MSTFFFTCNQIWLFPLMDGCHCMDTSQNWKKKKTMVLINAYDDK
jgi:hypothetical protein